MKQPKKQEQEIEPKTDYDISINHFYKLIETHQYLAKEYSKYLWTFSGGAIGLSVTLVSGAFGSSLKSGLKTLVLSWMFFVICILLTMISNKASQESFNIEIDALWDEISQKGVASSSHYIGKYVKLVKILEIFASISFFSGLLFLLCFIYKNI